MDLFDSYANKVLHFVEAVSNKPDLTLLDSLLLLLLLSWEYGNADEPNGEYQPFVADVDWYLEFLSDKGVF